MEKLTSRNYPTITYEKGEQIFFGPGEENLPFYFDVEETLTDNEEAMIIVANALDEVELYTESAKAHLKKLLVNEKTEDKDVVECFMAFHRDELEPEDVAKLFPVEKPSELSFVDMVDYLTVNMFGSMMDDDEQGFIMDLNFNPEITDELMVVYFDLEKQVINIAHES